MMQHEIIEVTAPMYSRVRDLQEVADRGDPGIIEYYIANHKDEKVLSKYIERMDYAIRICSRTGKDSSQYQTNKDVMLSLMEIAAIKQTIKSIEQSSQDEEGGLVISPIMKPSEVIDED